MRVAIWLLCASIGFSVAACHQAAPEEGATAASRDVITAKEIEDAGLVGNNTLEVVRTLRPHILADAKAYARDHPLKVAFNKGELRPLNDLVGLPAQSVAEIRYLSLAQAMGRYGMLATGPVLVITLKTNT